jgi:hypothetical protein
MIAFGLLVGHCLLRFDLDKRHAVAIDTVFGLLRLDLNRRRTVVIATVCALAGIAALLSVYNDPDLIVRVYRLIGPLATVSLELLFLIAAFAALAVLSQNSGFPALTLIVLTIVVCVMFPQYAMWTASALGLVYVAFAFLAFASGRIWSTFAMVLLIVLGAINLRQITQGASVGQNPEKRRLATASSGMNAPTAVTDYMCWLDQKGILATRTAEHLITSSRTQPNLTDQSVNGTVFLDTLAPIKAILKVREGLANEAVGRACSEIYRDLVHPEIQSQGCIEHAGVKDGKLQIVEIQDQTYGLPLGWKISQTSFAVIRWMLGKAELCPAAKETESGSKDGATPGQTAVQNDDPNAQLRDDILHRNSCVARLLLELVQKPAPP